jgi:hypothetical protein
MEQVQGNKLKTPLESDPRKENRNVPAGSETSPGPEDFDDIRPKDDGTSKPIDEETPENLHRTLNIVAARLSDVLCHRERRHVSEQLTMSYDRKQIIL